MKRVADTGCPLPSLLKGVFHEVLLAFAVAVLVLGWTVQLSNRTTGAGVPTGGGLRPIGGGLFTKSCYSSLPPCSCCTLAFQ